MNDQLASAVEHSGELDATSGADQLHEAANETPFRFDDDVPQSEPQFTEEERLEEQKHFNTVVAAFRYYRKLSSQSAHFKGMSDHYQRLLPDFPQRCSDLKLAVDVNSSFLQDVLKNVPFGDCFDSEPESSRIRPVGSFQMDKIQTTLRMFMRDWSTEGAPERSQSYSPLICAVQKYLPLDQERQKKVQILNPGAGLGRLAWELAKLGYVSIGNEFSLYMLFASNFMLNHCQEVESCRIYPWVNQSSNNLSHWDRMAAISIPDVNPADLPIGHHFGMVAGDFLEVFEPTESWDGIVTCFFLDTARNIFEYVEHIWQLLKPGGYWFNLGPLFYHFADMANECSIELSYDQLKTVVLNMGFEYLEEETRLPCAYVQNPRSMLRYEYSSVYFVCRKPL